MVNHRRHQKFNRQAVSSYGQQTISSADQKAVEGVLRSLWLTQGQEVPKFEKVLADYCGAKYAVVVSSGTAALHLAYVVAGLGEGDEVITTPNTFVATTNMLLAIGARPVFCDIRLNTYNIDEEKIEKLITKKTKAIVPVHFAGQPVNLEAIKKIAKKHKLLVIEDACHALGATYQGKKIGGIADLSVFSFHPVKPITTGEGGAIVTNNEKYYQRLQQLRSHGIRKNAEGFNEMVELGFNYRLTDLQAALGQSQLKHLDKFIQKRRTLVAKYHQELGGIKEVILPQEIGGGRSAWHIFVIRLKDPARRNKLMNFLKTRGIGHQLHYPAVYSHPFYRQNGYAKVNLAQEEKYQASCLTLPLHQNLSLTDVTYICQEIKRFFEHE